MLFIDKNCVIGIVGTGKMGQDIIGCFMNYDIKLVIICRDEEKILLLREMLEKQLRRKLKRKLITEEEFQKRCNNIYITNEYEALDECSLVIETIIENLQVKQSVMKKIELYTKSNCIIVSNTSSIDLEKLYACCNKLERCLGLHFFFPIRVTNYVEINITNATSIEVVNTLEELLREMNIQTIHLKPKGNMIISKVISTIVSYAVEIYNERNLSFSAIDQIIKKHIMMFGAFELIDSTGFYIITNSLHNFYSNFNNRYCQLYHSLEEQMKALSKKGFLGNKETGGFLAAEDKNKKLPDSCTDEVYIENVVRRMKAIVLNDLAFYCNQKIVTADELFQAVFTILGFNKNPREIFNDLGKEQIIQLLAIEYEKKRQLVYVAEDFKCYEEER